ncbi:copper homeostasis protein CutC [Microbacterium ureisolvens]|uniref:PF03932 family protein CutC n=1 Tax=Microbacterium ureisolvens TaxID=2781186 RepID=A0ABS7HU10_9MICO|nr:copper homeostasis protein CutC [Microbacterium ureisolvens]MBW9108290.1 copper homeostasis protein CutC [Microbacterium ureisolvens]
MTAAIVEIAVQDAAGARAAIGAGADRLELCQALAVGGLTPSIGSIEAACDAVGAERVNVLVRHRGGGFVYDPDEVAVVAADIRACVARGVGGVVVGALDEDGRADREALRRWKDCAGPAALVFHRAIDASPRSAEVFEALLVEGVDRVLTSGGAARSIQGIDRLAAYARLAGPALEVTAGGGVAPADIPHLLHAGVNAVHLSARRRAGLGAPAGPGGGADGHDVTDPGIVVEAVAAARR